MKQSTNKSVLACLLLAIMVALMTGGLFTAAASTPNYNVIAGVEFGEMQTFISTSSNVWHMEEDLLHPGYTIYSDNCQLWTTDGVRKWRIVGGSCGYAEGMGQYALFQLITGFHQFNSTLLVVADYNNHCMRLVFRPNNRTLPFVGSCKSAGSTNGRNAKFHFPWSIIQDPEDSNKLIISEYGNNALRSVDTNQRRVSTLWKTGLSNPLAIRSFTPDTITIGNNYFISELNRTTSSISRITGTSSSFAEGWLDQARYKCIRDIMKVNENVIIAADYCTHRLRVIDLKEAWVRSICTGGSGTSNGNIRRCQIRYPSSFLLRNDTLLIGQQGAIRKIKVRTLYPRLPAADTLPCPPQEINVTLQDGQDLAKVELPSRETLFYPAGQHIYQDEKKRCTSVVNVVDESEDFQCPKEVFLSANPLTQTGAFKFRMAGAQHHLHFPVGTHFYFVEHDEKNCSSEIKVFDLRLKRRLEVEVDYQISCSVLQDNITKQFLIQMLNHRRNTINEICGRECSSNQPVMTRCKNDILTVTWTTTRQFPGNTITLPEDVSSELQSRKPPHPSRSMELFIFGPNIFRNLQPIQEHGEYLRFILRAVCEGHNLDYNEENLQCN